MDASVRKVSFNGGIVSPYLDGRIDLARYQTGCVEMTNQIPCDWGGSVTRPGLIYDARLTGHTVLHSYVVSASVSYVLLFSNLELRIFRNGNQITINGSDHIDTPYLEADLYELKMDSLVDLLWIAHPNYNIRQLVRNTETDWTFAEIAYINPPMIPREGEATKLTPSATTGTGVTVTADADIFQPGHVGSYWEIGHELEAFSVEVALDLLVAPETSRESDWISVTGDWAFTTGGNWIADVEIERRYKGETKVVRSFKARSSLENIATTGSEIAGTELRIVVTNTVADGNNAPEYNPSANISVTTTKIYGLVKVTGYTSATEVTVDVLRDLRNATETELWKEGSYSDYRGFPATVAIFERRLMFAATKAFPNRYWASRQDDRQDFAIATDVQAAIAFDLPTRDVINWMLAEQQVIVATRSQEVTISSGRDDLPISPENSIARVNGNIGSSRVAPVRSSNSILYSERRGRRVRELSVDKLDNSLSNTDLTAFAPHLCDASVLQMTASQLDQKLVYVLLSNRKLLCLNHNKDQAMSSWFVIETEGDFESVTSLPGDQTEDIVYVVTRRTINGTEVRQLEHFSVGEWDKIESGDMTNMVYADMARTYTHDAPVSSLSGLSDWEGLEVQILGDGGVQPAKTVVNGSIDLTTDASVVTIGLKMNSSLVPLWFEDANTPSQGRKRKLSKIHFSTFNSGNINVTATDEEIFGTLAEGQELLSEKIARRNFTDELGEAPDLEKGYFEVSLESRYSKKQSIKFSRSAPLPMVIQSLHLIYNVGTK